MIVESPLVVRENSHLRCNSCAWRCKIGEGKAGYCGVRRNEGGKLDLIVYGRPSAVHIDPIEKKPFYHFLPGARAFSIGTIGCNFQCQFCQNWELSQALRLNIPAPMYDLPPEKAAQLVREHDTEVVAYTYNEPIIWWEYARDIAELLPEREHVFVSSGYETEEAYRELTKFLSAINIDLKGFTEEFYWRYTRTHLKFVKESIRHAKEAGLWVEITTLLIPGLNDSEEEIREAARFLRSIDDEMPWHFSAFHPDFKLRDRPPTPYETLVRAREIAMEEGMKYVYIGNVPGNPYESTYCPSCGAVLIERNAYSVRVVHLDLEEGRCDVCGFKVEGIWKPTKGND